MAIQGMKNLKDCKGVGGHGDVLEGWVGWGGDIAVS